MRVLVQDCKTFEFYRGKLDWTLDSGMAHDFGSSVKALEFCLKTRWNRELQIVMKFDSPTYDVSLPITDGCKEEHAKKRRRKR